MLIVKIALTLFFIGTSVANLRIVPHLEEFITVNELKDQLNLGNRVKLSYIINNQSYNLMLVDQKLQESYRVIKSRVKHGIYIIDTDAHIYYYVIILNLVIRKRYKSVGKSFD